MSDTTQHDGPAVVLVVDGSSLSWKPIAGLNETQTAAALERCRESLQSELQTFRALLDRRRNLEARRPE